MRRAGKANSNVANPGLSGRTGGLAVGVGHMLAKSVSARRRLATVTAICLIALMSITCAADVSVTPDLTGSSGTSLTDSKGNTQIGGVTVPDKISDLDSAEVERRLGRLLIEPSSVDGDALAAQDVEPTAASGEPTIQEILDLLNSEAASTDSGEIVISVSQSTIDMLMNPVLTIKTPPLHGSATVVSQYQILYMPGDQQGNGDWFEYELFDGTESVIALTVELTQ